MDIIESLGLVCFGGFIVLAYVAVMATIAIVSTQAKQRSAKRILEARTRDAFADLETPKNKFRFRLLAGVALISGLGFTCSIGVFMLQIATEFSKLYWVTIAIGLIFGTICAFAGLLMNREIERRL